MSFYSSSAHSDIKLLAEDLSATLILEVKRGDKIFTCSAVAIEQNIVVTAAHCMNQADSARVLWNETYHPKDQSIDVIDFKIHPAYDRESSNYQHDIAILHLADALPSHIVPAKVYSKARVPAKCELVRVGYGGRNGVNRLFYSSPLFLQQSDDIRTIISQDSTAVLGDSGGGLFFKGSLDEEMQLLAIHSTFEAPNVVFSVFVPQYMEWISVWKQVWKYQKESLHTAVDETL